MKAAKKPTEDPLVGKWFHSFNGRCEKCAQDVIQYQGQILGSVATEEGKKLYLVQFYEFFMGSESNQELIPLEKLLDWKFYPSDEHMRHYFGIFSARHNRCMLMEDEVSEEKQQNSAN